MYIGKVCCKLMYSGAARSSGATVNIETRSIIKYDKNRDQPLTPSTLVQEPMKLRSRLRLLPSPFMTSTKFFHHLNKNVLLSRLKHIRVSLSHARARSSMYAIVQVTDTIINVSANVSVCVDASASVYL